MNIVLADDDADYRYLVRLALAREPDLVLVGEAESAAALPAVVSDGHPDVVLLDSALPGGIGALTEVREAAPGVRVIMTSSLPAAAISTRVADAGAVGSLAKDIPIAQLPQAVRELGELVGAAERALAIAQESLPCDDLSVLRSRRFATAALDGWCDEEMVSTVELLVSEVATNGVQHARSTIDVSIALGATSVRVDVADRSTDRPVLSSPPDDVEHGRGLYIVDRLSSRWGVQLRRTGKSVWFEVPWAPAGSTLGGAGVGVPR